MKYIFIFLISLSLINVMIEVSGHLIQSLGDVKQPNPHIMRQVYCVQYYIKMSENITDVKIINKPLLPTYYR